jgi:hypothetical protein
MKRLFRLATDGEGPTLRLAMTWIGCWLVSTTTAVALTGCLRPAPKVLPPSALPVPKSSYFVMKIPRRPVAAPTVDARLLAIGRQAIPHSREPEGLEGKGDSAPAEAAAR